MCKFCSMCNTGGLSDADQKLTDLRGCYGLKPAVTTGGQAHHPVMKISRPWRIAMTTIPENPSDQLQEAIHRSQLIYDIVEEELSIRWGRNQSSLGSASCDTSRVCQFFVPRIPTRLGSNRRRALRCRCISRRCADCEFCRWPGCPSRRRRASRHDGWTGPKSFSARHGPARPSACLCQVVARLRSRPFGATDRAGA